MFFSVIVPCYNVGPAISELLGDITRQMDDDCELILVNDGSTDDTSTRIRAFIDTSSRARQIVFKETTNAGAAKARSAGLALAQGKFVFFCDSDDLIGADFFAQVKHQASLHPQMDLLYFSSSVVADTDGEGPLSLVASKVSYTEAGTFSRGAELLRYNLSRGMYTAAVWTFVARRALIIDSGAAFTERTAHEDHLFTLKVIMGARLIVTIPDMLYRQKIRAGSLTNSRKNARYVIERISAYHEAAHYLRGVPAAWGLYRAWSFHSVMYLLRDNRGLLLHVMCSSTGVRFFAVHLVDMVNWTARAAARRLVRR